MPEAGSGEFQLNEDISFQRRQWRAERIAWVTAVIILVLALAGFAGRGPVSSTQRSDSEGILEVSYDRIVRRDSPTAIEVTIANPDGRSEVSALISGHLIDGAEITRIHPEPSSMITSDNGFQIILNVSPESAEATVRLTIEHETIGPESSTIALGDGPNVDIKQWVLP